MFDRARLRQWLAWNVRKNLCVLYHEKLSSTFWAQAAVHTFRARLRQMLSRLLAQFQIIC